MRFELLRNRRIVSTNGEYKIQLAVSALQKTPRSGHQDSDAMGRKHETVRRHYISQLSTAKLTLNAYIVFIKRPNQPMAA